jgi:hypothetical protein
VCSGVPSFIEAHDADNITNSAPLGALTAYSVQIARANAHLLLLEFSRKRRANSQIMALPCHGAFGTRRTYTNRERAESVYICIKVNLRAIGVASIIVCVL